MSLFFFFFFFYSGKFRIKVGNGMIDEMISKARLRDEIVFLLKECVKTKIKINLIGIIFFNAKINNTLYKFFIKGKRNC